MRVCGWWVRVCRCDHVRRVGVGAEGRYLGTHYEINGEYIQYSYSLLL